VHLPGSFCLSIYRAILTDMVHSSIFKAYDIRGIYGEEFDEQGAYAIARGYAALLQGENPGIRLKVAVGMDMRLSSPQIKEQVVSGLLDSGIDVDDIGLVSTPTFYFGVAKFGYYGGIQVSASHNPKEYNGLKMVRAHAVPVSRDSGIYAIRDMVVEDLLPSLAEVQGTRGTREGLVEEEVRDQVGRAGTEGIKKFKIVIDAANSMGALYSKALFQTLSDEVIEMNFELDGTFPAHEADPLKPENLKDLSMRIIAEGADLGIAPDGDGDRLFILDEKGETLPPHILRGIMAEIELREKPGSKVAYDIRPGRITKDVIEELGGSAIVTPVGHSLIKEMMIKEGAIFGGESSGHFYYSLTYGTFEAPILLIVKFLKWLSEQNRPLSEAISPYKKYVNSGEINFHLADREAIEEKIGKIKSKYADGEQIFIDGVSVEYPDFWFNVRASNTEPLLRLMVEARDESVLQNRVKELQELIAA
jgi:phosphomannomutase